MHLLHSLRRRGQRRHLQPHRFSPVLHLVVRVALKFGCIMTPKGMLQENMIRGQISINILKRGCR